MASQFLTNADDDQVVAAKLLEWLEAVHKTSFIGDVVEEELKEGLAAMSAVLEEKFIK